MLHIKNFQPLQNFLGRFEEMVGYGGENHVFLSRCVMKQKYL